MTRAAGRFIGARRIAYSGMCEACGTARQRFLLPSRLSSVLSDQVLRP